MLNYLRSVERTLTFDLAGLQLEEGELCSTAEETGWMNAARGGAGEAGGLGSLQFNHNTPVDYKVRCSEFMDFAEVENLHDFYSCEERVVHTQDQRGFYIMYDAALKDLDELENELLLIGSHYIKRYMTEKMRKAEGASASNWTADVHSWAGTDVDRVAVLLDLWTCETEFLESKVQLLNCYCEAYQHAAGTEERFALARVVTDIMHSRPQLDLNQDHFVQAYRAETDCLRSHQQLIKKVLDYQIENQRQYLQRIWRDDRKGCIHDFGLPLNYVPKHMVSLGGSSPALMNVFLLEVHPSLCLASAVYQGLVQAHTELCQLHRATSVSDKLLLQQKLLHQALQSWNNLGSPGASYSSQIQRDLFSGVFFEDPGLVQNVGLSLVKSAEEKHVMQGREKQLYAVETFSKLLELVTVRHRLLESASETEHLAQLYRNVASELGFSEFHLHLRPVQFEVAEQKDQTEQRPLFITAVLEDDSSVDRFLPSHLPLSIQELDEEQVGRFSFSSEEAVSRLMNTQSIENLQVTLACQVTQKNALISAVKVACLCYWAESVTSSAEGEEFLHSGKLHKKSNMKTQTTTRERLVEAFVSIQLEKVSLRDEMLNSFVKKKRAVGGLIRTLEEAAKIKRSLIIKFLKKFSTRISQYCVRAQIVEYYYSLTSLLDDVPSVRRSHFTTEQTSVPEACAAALHHTLHIVSALHDIIYYLVSFSRLGNTENSWSRRNVQEAPRLVADWGGAEGIGAELQEIQRQVDRLSDPSSPESVGRLLQLRRQVLLLQFDTAVRHLIREAFLSAGDMASYQSVSDNMTTALPLLSDRIQADVFSITLPVPRPLETRGCRAQSLFSWRSFTACHGLFPLHVWDIPPIEHCMQLCLSGLKDCSRLQTNAAILGVSLLMEDVLNSGGDAEPVRLHGNKDDLLHDGKPNEEDKSCSEVEEKKTCVLNSTSPPPPPPPPQDPLRVQRVLKGFLLLTKQLQVFKESWARRRLGPEIFSSPTSYQQFINLYRAEIFYPSMKALARQMGKERDYELLISGSRSFLPPAGASEIDVKAWQLHTLLEITECDMIRSVQRRVHRELTLVLSERTRQDPCLPTELWKKASLKHSVSPERPQIVEAFVEQLMEGAEQVDGQLVISQDHLRLCSTHLGSSLMERERRSFLLYSHFYEQILQQQTQLLYQKEQDLKNLNDSQTSNVHKEVSVLCRGMMLEISALQARVAHLQEEKRSLEERLSLRFKERYDPLVRHLFSTCLQLKLGLDERQWQVEQDVSVMVNTIRAEGVDRIMKLKKKHGCTKDNDGLSLTQLKREEVHELSLENSQLTALLCKLKALSRWRQVVDQGKLHRRLLQTQQSEITSRTEALRVKMVAEDQVIFLQEELNAARQMLTSCQAECSRTKRLLDRKTEELQEARHQSAQEARSRQELESYRVQRLEEMRADVEDRDGQLRALNQQLDRGGRMSQIQRQRSAREIRQVKEQLHQERSLKQEAFQQVEKLKHQVNDTDAASSRCNSTAGQSRTCFTLSVSRLSSRSPSAGLHRVSRQQSDLQRHQRVDAARSRSNTRLVRAKADPSRLQVLTADTLLPEL
nr:PREDICTED: transmembrane protein FLJ37396 [Paralichthys olivaceus]